MKRSMTFRYALVVLTYWVAFATVSAFSSLYLLNIGFSNTFIGTLLAVAGIGSSILQPIASTWAERPDSPALKRIMIGMALLTAAVAAAVRLFAPVSAALDGVLYGLMILMLQTINPMVNALGMESINRGERLNFGISRAGGSVGYGAVSFAMGLVAAKYTPYVVPVLGAVFFVLFAVTVALYPQSEQKVVITVRERSRGTGAVAFFKKYPRFLWVLVGTTLLFTSHSLVNTFNLQIVLSKGGTSVEMGTATAIAACIEIPGMILFATLSRRLRCDTLLVISGVFFVLKCIGSLLAPSMPVYYAVQICQLFGWGLFAVASVRYTNAVMQPEDTIKGQGYTTVVQSLASVLGTTIGGRLMDASGVPAMLVFGIIVGCIGTLVVLLSAEKVRLSR